MLSIVPTSSCLPWCDVGMTCTRMFEMIWPLKRLRITAHGWIKVRQGQCLLSQRSDLEPCLWFVLGTHLPFTTLCSGRGLMGFVQLASGSSLWWQRKHSDTAFCSRDLTWDRPTHKRPFYPSKSHVYTYCMSVYRVEPSSWWKYQGPACDKAFTRNKVKAS